MILNSKFYQNKGEMEGGAISWFGNMPNIEKDNIFTNNEAIYGPDISSYAIRIGVDIYENTTSKKIFSSKLNQSIPLLDNISSGNPIPYKLSIFIIDVYDQIVITAKG